MSKEYDENNIKALEARVHVRLRPTMYFEKCFEEKSLDSLPFEVLCHAFDEYYDGNCKRITLTFWSNSFEIEYDMGMPLNKRKYSKLSHAEIIMTKISACSNLKKHLAVGHRFCGLGMATINFASKRCELTTVWEKKKGVFQFEEGKTISRKIKTCDEKEDWTKIKLVPDENIFGELKFTSKGIVKKAKEIKRDLTNLDISIINKIE